MTTRIYELWEVRHFPEMNVSISVSDSANNNAHCERELKREDFSIWLSCQIKPKNIPTGESKPHLQRDKWGYLPIHHRDYLMCVMLNFMNLAQMTALLDILKAICLIWQAHRTGKISNEINLKLIFQSF